MTFTASKASWQQHTRVLLQSGSLNFSSKCARAAARRCVGCLALKFGLPGLQLLIAAILMHAEP